jgi:sulfane dehydrogenase subunit SoxC
VMPEGLDAVVGSSGHVRRPMPLEKALNDVLIVYAMNGETLPADHGFPVRMLVPGWVGISSIKWVGKITVSEEPLFCLWNTSQYRLFGSAYPDTPLLTNQMVKSAFELPLPGTLSAGPQTLTGRSWSGSGNVNRVEVSMDGGATWREAALGPPKRDLHDSGRRNIPQAWVQWWIDWNPSPGSYALRARATDRHGSTQPPTVPFNDFGYAFWAVVQHPVNVT